MAKRRGSKPGERRGGRKKGTPNKVTLDIIKAIDECSLAPLAGLMALMKKKGKGALSPGTKAQVYLDLMRYLYPHRKPADINGDDRDVSNFEVVVKWADDNDDNAGKENANAPNASANATPKNN